MRVKHFTDELRSNVQTAGGGNDMKTFLTTAAVTWIAILGAGPPAAADGPVISGPPLGKKLPYRLAVDVLNPRHNVCNTLE